MDHDQLRALMTQLQGEISRAEKLDDRNHELLRGIQADMQHATSEDGLASSSLPPPERLSRWQEAVVSLEGSHPQLASAIEQGMVALSNMGL